MSAAWPWLALLSRRDLAVLNVLANATVRGQALTWEQVQEGLGDTYYGTHPFLDGAYALAWRSDGAREWLVRPVTGGRPKWRRDLERRPGQCWEVASVEVLAAHRSGVLAGHKVDRQNRAAGRKFAGQRPRPPRILSGAVAEYVRTGLRQSAFSPAETSLMRHQAGRDAGGAATTSVLP